MTGLSRRGFPRHVAFGVLLLGLAACTGTDKPVGEPRTPSAPAHEEPVAVSAAPLVLTGMAATKSGSYRLQSGATTLFSATNYRAGNISSGTADLRRGYVVFDLTSVDGTITAASLSLSNSSNSGSAQTLGLYPVAAANIANLGVGGTPSTLYTDLGDAAGYAGSSTYYSAALSSVSANPEPSASGFTLGGSVVADLASAKAGSKLFAIGITYYETSGSIRYIFDDVKGGALLILTVNNRSAGQTCMVSTDCASGTCATNCCSGACTGANGTRSCASGTGTCSVACNSGFGDCSGGAADGCETNTNTSATNCGACGTSCSNSHITTPTCAGGSCNGTCNAGFADCNGNKQTDGCETTIFDTANCGGCGLVCSSNNITTTLCPAGSCTGACNAGFADCNGNKQTDGCEANLNTNASNCSACGTVCSNNNIATPTCAAGACNGSCNSGFADCNGNKLTDGCEINTNTSATNCGGCGVTCQTNTGTTANTCSAGTCAPTCAAGYLDCDGDPRNGCEKQVNTLSSCGTTCTTSNCDDGNTCTADACVAGVCRHPAGNVGTTCRAVANTCDTAEVCPAAVTPSNVDSTAYSDYSSAPSWTCSTSTTLTSGVSNSTTSIPVTSTSGFTTSSGAIVIDDEIMFVSSATGTAFTVTRGQLGTTAVTHNSSAVVSGVTVIDSTGATSACPAVTRDTCGGSIALTTCTNNVAQLNGSGPNVMIVRLNAMTLGNSHMIKLIGDKPIVFLVKGNVTLDTGAIIDAGAMATTAGPGGSLSSQCSAAGTGGTGSVSSTGGGGGGFGSAGGTGGRLNANPVGAAGAVASDTDLQPLRGGCSGGIGGNGNSGNGAPGAGGGAFQISALGTITIGTGSNVATLSAGGGGGLASTSSGIGSGGGGSGGAILLESPVAPSFGTNGAIRTHGGASGAGRSSQTGSPGENAHTDDDTRAVGGANATGGAPAGANGGLCSGDSCSVASGSGTNGTATSNDGAGGGGGGGIAIVQTSTSGTGFGTGTCPADVYASAGTVCRMAGNGGCDVAETCTGSSPACPSDGFQASGTTCRAVAGGCDVAETCTGSSGTCPADTFVASGTSCRAIASVCDPVAETCTGSSAACPADTFAASTTLCRASIGTCDVADFCTGSSSTCPADAFTASTTQCRGSTGVCDPAETCTGTSNTCPSDSLSAAGTTCRAAAGLCDAVETCTGSSSACPADALSPAGTICRTQNGSVCDLPDTCTGTSMNCTDNVAALGTDCGYATSATTIWASGAPTNTTDFTTGDWTSTSVTELAAGSAPANWGSNVLKYVTTSNSTSNPNRYIYTKAASSSYTPSTTDYLEYDVYLDDNAGGIGGIDVKDSGIYWRTLGAVDQNGLGLHPATDISARAYHTWYHRRFAVTRTAQLSLVDVACERDNASTTSTAYFDNIMFTKKAGACDGVGACKVKDTSTCATNSDCASGTCGGGTCVTPVANGLGCTTNYGCISGFCADGVCCNSACGNGAVDCLACSVAAGASVNGTCATAAANTVCRPATGACDVAEVCDGALTTCPIDTTL